MLQPLILLVVLIFLNAVFASAEIAVISMNASKLKKMSSEGNKKATKLSKLTEQPARFLATIQVAITLAGLLQSAFAAENFAGPLVSLLIDWGIKIDADILKTISIIVITIVLAYFNLVFGELVPKRIAMKKSESLALGMAGMLYTVAKITAPIVWLLTASTNLIVRLFGINPNETDEIVTEEEIRMMLDEGNIQGTIGIKENQMIQNVFELNDTKVREICTHRREIISLDLGDSNETWANIIRDNRHTFYPIHDKNPDNIIGVLDTRDYFRTDNKSKENLMQTAVANPFFIHENMTASVLFEQMKEKRDYFAVIIDEYGTLSGIVTLHDLVESLVGDIYEEEDTAEEEPIIQISDTEWKIHGMAPLDDVEKVLHKKLGADEYDTFNGYVCDLLDRIPNDGETFSFETKDLTINILQVDNHIVETAIVIKKP